MSTKQAAFAAVGLVGAALLFSYIYQQKTAVNEESSVDTIPSMSVSKGTSAPVTPDTATDDIIDQAIADRDDLDSEAAGEISDLESGNAKVNDLSTVYDENEL
ncbi:MAG: hypothetical protein ABI747_01545 [Candidatus Moraniibacteriota bacterium]